MTPVPTNHMPEIRLSIAIAVQGAQANLPEIFAALQPTADVEILICHTSDDPLPPALTQLLDSRADVQTVPGASGALIPEMWRDGFLVARGAWVATLTAHCPPHPDWLRRALALVNNEATVDHAAFGGAIVADPEADKVNRAVHLLRYVDAGPYRTRGQVQDLSADNALYCRKAVMECTDLLPDGFWEPNYHRRFLACGLVMEHIPDLVVMHRNRYSASDFRRQRRRHGRVFGRHRSEGRPLWVQWAMLLASPAVLPIFAFKQTRKVLARPTLRSTLPQAAVPFYGFLASWCLGEACGYADALCGCLGGDRR